ncbi:MAG TPA: hypothetical protein VF215_07780 [Thermoanaerobaculia bacterium]
MTAEPLSPAQRKVFLTTALLTALTRFVPLSLAPWDWDEVLFCLAIGDYNVALHQPHPAGFPLYVFLGKLARFFADSDFHALQAVNVIAAMCIFPAVFALARAFRLDFLSSLGAGLLFAFLPNVWFYGGTAFSDVPGMVVFIAAMAAYLTSGSSTRRYVIASIWMAAGILVRPQNAVVAVFPWTIATYKLARERRFRAIIAGSLVLILLVGIGYGLAAYATGFGDYIAALRGHSDYVTRADSIANLDRPSFGEVLLMQLNPFDSGKTAMVLNAFALIGIVAGRRRLAAEVLLTFVPFFVFSALATNPLGTGRFSLNYMAGVVILAVEGIEVLARLAMRVRAATSTRYAVHAVLLALLLGRHITWALPAFTEPRTTYAPPTAAALWLHKYSRASQTIFVDGSMWPWIKYYVPGHKQVGVGNTSEALAHRDAMNGWYVAMAPPPPQGAIGFYRPRNRTWNIVTKRGFVAFVQPTRELIGFGSGWHGLEQDGSTIWHWSMRRAVMNFGPDTAPRELRLQFHVPIEVYTHPVRVTFTFNGQHLDTIVAKSDNEVRYVVQGRGDRPNQLIIDISDTFVPAEKGGSADHRELGLMMHSWKWSPVGARM